MIQRCFPSTWNIGLTLKFKGKIDGYLITEHDHITQTMSIIYPCTTEVATEVATTIGPDAEVSDRCLIIMTSSNGNIFRVTGHLCGLSPVNSQHKGQWRGALIFSLIWVWINGWINTRDAGDLRRYHSHYDVIVMSTATRLSQLSGQLHMMCECLWRKSTCDFKHRIMWTQWWFD